MVICTKRFWNQVTDNKSHATNVTQKLNCNREIVIKEKVLKLNEEVESKKARWCYTTSESGIHLF